MYITVNVILPLSAGRDAPWALRFENKYGAVQKKRTLDDVSVLNLFNLYIIILRASMCCFKEVFLIHTNIEFVLKSPRADYTFPSFCLCNNICNICDFPFLHLDT